MNKGIVKLAPSILSADFACLGQQVAEAEKAGVDRIHIDMMDGHFVPNLSLGAPIVESLRLVTHLPLETHLMISDTDLFLEEFVHAGSDSLLVHWEGNNNLHRTVQRVKALGKRVGVVINPATPLTYEGAGDFENDNPAGKNLHFGIREHAMAAIVNGLSLSKLRVFGATFFIFSDCARPAMRLSALMELPSIFIFTHDAMGDGEDGPTHQSVEHLASLRANPEVIFIASGSEVSLAVEAHEKLVDEGIRSRVVSMPSWEIFEHQTQDYQDKVLPPHVTARVAVKQASTFGWERYLGRSGRIIGMKTFGPSAPLKELQRKFGFEPDLVTSAAKELLGRR